MKKILFSAVIAAALFSACKKDYTCTCTTTSPGGLTASGKTTIKDTKKHAKSTCEDGSKTEDNNTVTCRID